MNKIIQYKKSARRSIEQAKKQMGASYKSLEHVELQLEKLTDVYGETKMTRNILQDLNDTIDDILALRIDLQRLKESIGYIRGSDFE